jgi:hypothetical protein
VLPGARYKWICITVAAVASCTNSQRVNAPLDAEPLLDAESRDTQSNDAQSGDVPSIDADGVSSDAGAAGPLVAVPLAACTPLAYTAGVTIGGSGPFQLLLDTGSATLGVAGAGCTSCADAGVSALYQPGATAVDQHTVGTAMFGALAASGFSGEIYEDSVGLGSPPASARIRLVSIGRESSFLVGRCGPAQSTPQGVIGFQPGLSAIAGTDSYFDQLVRAGGVPDVFATQLCPNGGTLWLGGYDPSFTQAPPVFTPSSPPGFSGYVYTVHFASICVLGTTIPVPAGGYTAALLDTGSDITSLPPNVFSVLTSAIASSPAFSQIFGASASSFFSDASHCVDLTETKAALDQALPPIDLVFGATATVTVHAVATESYLFSPSSGRWCPAVTSRAPTPSFQSIAAILGAPMLSSNVVIFDRAHERVGFAPHRPCL